MELVACPTCGQPAEIDWREPLPSTDGPIEHVKLRCLGRHMYLMPSAGLVSLLGPPASAPDGPEQPVPNAPSAPPP